MNDTTRTPIGVDDPQQRQRIAVLDSEMSYVDEN